MRSLLLIIITLIFITASAQWSANPGINNAVCNFTGSQTNVQMVADGTGGAIMVWQDTRNSSTDIYAQRISATGTLLWNADGVALCTAAFNQLNPRIVTDGAGGAVIAWIDDRDGGGAGNYDIYAQRINSSGIVQWAADGVAVCTATGIQNNQQLLADNSGAMIVWSDGRGSSANADIYAQRLNQVGTALWTLNGAPVCTAPSLQNMPQIISDGGAGSAIVVWEDWRNFSQSDIYAQHISNGFTDWTFNGVVICSESNLAHQYNTRIVADGSGGAIMCWEDKRNAGSNTDLYAQRVSNSGLPQWSSNGIAICTASGIQFSHQLVADAAGGAIIAWEDRRNNRDIYTQRINASGAAQWAANGIPVCNTFDIQEEPQLVARVSGGAVFIWTDSRNSFQQDIYAQGIDATGNALWTTNGVPVANESHAQSTAQLITDGAGGALIAWQDLRTTADYDIYSSRLFAGGVLPLRLLSFTAVPHNSNITLAWETENEINSSRFDVEVSANGTTFTKLATVTARNLPGKNQYGYVHSNITDPVLFYRLKQLDLDEKFEYSSIVKVTSGKEPQITLYPNPATDFIRLKNSDPSVISRLQLINAAGKQLMTFTANNQMQYAINTLKPGFYLLKLLKTDNTVIVLQFLKQ